MRDYTIATADGAVIAQVRKTDLWDDDPDGYYDYDEDRETSDGAGNVSGRYPGDGQVQA